MYGLHVGQDPAAAACPCKHSHGAETVRAGEDAPRADTLSTGAVLLIGVGIIVGAVALRRYRAAAAAPPVHK